MGRRKAGDTPDIDGGGNAAPIAASQLKSIVERVERLIEERKAVSEDISQVYAEAKGNGFNPKIIRILIRKRAMDRAEREEQEAVLDLYESAVGL